MIIDAADIQTRQDFRTRTNRFYLMLNYINHFGTHSLCKLQKDNLPNHFHEKQKSFLKQSELSNLNAYVRYFIEYSSKLKKLLKTLDAKTGIAQGTVVIDLTEGAKLLLNRRLKLLSASDSTDSFDAFLREFVLEVEAASSIALYLGVVDSSASYEAVGNIVHTYITDQLKMKRELLKPILHKTPISLKLLSTDAFSFVNKKVVVSPELEMKVPDAKLSAKGLQTTVTNLYGTSVVSVPINYRPYAVEVWLLQSFSFFFYTI